MGIRHPDPGSHPDDLCIRRERHRGQDQQHPESDHLRDPGRNRRGDRKRRRPAAQSVCRGRGQNPAAAPGACRPAGKRAGVVGQLLSSRGAFSSLRGDPFALSRGKRGDSAARAAEPGSGAAGISGLHQRRTALHRRAAELQPAGGTFQGPYDHSADHPVRRPGSGRYDCGDRVLLLLPSQPFP